MGTSIPRALLMPKTLYLNRILAGLLILGGLTALLSIVTTIQGAPFVYENDHRLAPSLAILKGFSLYYPKEGGPVLSSIYGPITAFAFLPAAFLKVLPSRVVQFATITALIYFFLPAILLCLTLAERECAKLAKFRYRACVLFFGVVLLNGPLQRASAEPHADAPALGLCALACFFLLRRRDNHADWFDVLLAAMCVACGVLAKQNMAPLPPVFAAWLLFRDGWKQSLGFCLAGITIAGLILVVVGHTLATPGAMLLNLVTIPTHQPLRKADFFPTVAQVGYQSMVLAALPIIALVQNLESGTSSLRITLRRNPRLLLLLSGAALATTSVIGYIKAGGNINALSPAIYFLAIAFVAELIPFLDGVSDSTNRESIARVTLLAIVLSFAILLSLPSILYGIAHTPKLKDCAMDNAFRYSKAHPDSIYFPDYPLAVLLAEGRLYHFSWGLQDREQAGYPVKAQEFLRYTPPSHVMALTLMNFPWEAAIQAHCGQMLHPSVESELPGFSFCTVRDRDAPVYSSHTAPLALLLQSPAP